MSPVGRILALIDAAADEVLEQNFISTGLAGDLPNRSVWLAHGIMTFFAFCITLIVFLAAVSTIRKSTRCGYFRPPNALENEESGGNGEALEQWGHDIELPPSGLRSSSFSRRGVCKKAGWGNGDDGT